MKQNGSPYIVEDRVGGCPEVVPIKFDSPQCARDFVEKHKNSKYFEGFWCNMSQTEEEREEFRRNTQPLYKIKRAVLETTGIDASRVVVKKSHKKVYFVEGEHLKFLAEMISRKDINWDPAISD